MNYQNVDHRNNLFFRLILKQQTLKKKKDSQKTFHVLLRCSLRVKLLIIKNSICTHVKNNAEKAKP
jgi:hypothetical protein